MERAEKVAEVAGVRDDFSSANATLVTHYRGLTVKELAQLRTALRATNAQMRIVKNTLARRAVADAGITGLDEFLTGPTGLVFCKDDPVGPAKALKAFAKTHPALEIRGGYLDGAVLSEAEARALAELKSREELLQEFVGLMYGALANTARLLQAATQKQAQLFAALAAEGGPEAKGFGSSQPAKALSSDTAAEMPVEAAPEVAEVETVVDADEEAGVAATAEVNEDAPAQGEEALVDAEVLDVTKAETVTDEKTSAE